MRPVGIEMEFAVGMGKAVEVMRGAEVGLQITPQISLELFDIAMAALLQGRVDKLARRHFEAGMHGVEALGKTLQHLMVRAALARRIDQLGANGDMLVTATVIEIVMLHEH